MNGDGAVDERDRETARPTSLIRRAHKRGLRRPHVDVPQRAAAGSPSDYDGDPKDEYKLFYALGIDGLFSDFPDTAVAARDEFFAELSRTRRGRRGRPGARG